jgi:hypothetical protein
VTVRASSAWHASQRCSASARRDPQAPGASAAWREHVVVKQQLQRWAHSTTCSSDMAPCFEKWVIYIARHRYVKAEYIKIIEQWQARSLVEAIRTWNQCTWATTQLCANRLSRHQQVIKFKVDGLYRWTRRLVRKDMDTWQQQTRFRSNVMNTLHRILRRATSKTVGSWHKVTASNDRVRIRLSRVLARLWNRTTSRVFEAWYARAQEDK